MNVLWLRAEYPLPLDSGAKKRSFNLLKHSAAELSSVLLGFSHADSLPPGPNLSSVLRRELTVRRRRERKAGLPFYLRVLSNLGSSHPYFIKRYTDRRITSMLRELFREETFDILICDGLHMAANVDFSLPVPKMLLNHETETTLWQQRYETAHGTLRRAYFNYEVKRMAAYEAEMCNRFDLVLAVSDRDRQRLEDDLGVRVPTEVVGTGVDCSYFRPRPEATVKPRRLVFTGSIDLLSNIDGLLWFAAEVLPLVRRQHPEVSLDIVGPDPASEIRALGRKDKAVRVTGWVTDVRPYIAEAEAFVVPLRAPGGTRVKIYEAMGMKKPVVSTAYGAEGLPVAHGTHLLIADHARDFAAAVNELFDNPEKRDSIAENGWRMVHENYDWSAVARRFVTLCRELVDSPPAD